MWRSEKSSKGIRWMQLEKFLLQTSTTPLRSLARVFPLSKVAALSPFWRLSIAPHTITPLPPFGCSSSRQGFKTKGQQGPSHKSGRCWKWSKVATSWQYLQWPGCVQPSQPCSFTSRVYEGGSDTLSSAVTNDMVPGEGRCPTGVRRGLNSSIGCTRRLPAALGALCIGWRDIDVLFVAGTESFPVEWVYRSGDRSTELSWLV